MNGGALSLEVHPADLQSAPADRVLRQPLATPEWIPDPYLHIGDDRVYNPITDLTLVEAEDGYRELRGILEGWLALDRMPEAKADLLRRSRWLVPASADLDARFLLKYVSLEAHTVCNQACYFCPVSVDPRKSYFMPTEQYADIVRQVGAYRSTIEAVFMISYNEPTIDPRFVDQVRLIKEQGLPPAVLSNGSGLTPEKTDGLVALGGLRYFSVNLSTLDRDKYRQDRGRDHLAQVLRNLDYVKDHPIAEEMDLVVLGTGDSQHQSDHAAIAQRFAGSAFNVKYFEVNDRAGYMPIGIKVDGSKQQLAGCRHMGSRPLQHLHITPQAKCILCCQDYSATQVVGDLSRNRLDEVLTGPAMKLMRRWVYGRDEAPDDFICRSCEFALIR